VCGSMVDIQSLTAEIRRGKKRRRNHSMKICMACLITQGGHKTEKLNQVWSPPMTSGLETEWDYSGRKGDGMDERRK